MPSHAMPPEQARLVRRARLRATPRMLVKGLPVAAGGLTANAVLSNGNQEHASVLYYVAGTAVAVLVTFMSVLLAAIGKWLAERSFRPRPRWQYLLFAAGYAVPVAAFAACAALHQRYANGNGWEPMAGGLTAIACAVACVLMLGRGLARGRRRSFFYVSVPMWLAPDAPQPLTSPAEPGT